MVVYPKNTLQRGYRVCVAVMSSVGSHVIENTHPHTLARLNFVVCGNRREN